jgi:uncharacterized RDD family membrane protein YckC
MRDLPGARKKERTWRDEVNERLKDRKRRRQGGTTPELPLFDDAPGSPPATPPASAPGPRKTHVAPPPEPPPAPVSLERALDDGLRGARDTAPFPREDALPDFPLRSGGPETADATEADTMEAEPEAPRVALPPEPPPPPAPAPRTVELGEDSLDRPRDEDWPLELRPPAPAATPVERPAWFGERLQAGAVDLGLLVGLWSIVVYFASRTAHVAIAGLLPGWPFLAAFLAFLGLVYAAYFTGTTGQSLGKILCGLRVVDTAGRPPGYARSFARAALGAAGVVALGAGLLPMAFDPARRALHDRLFRTRVVKG